MTEYSATTKNTTNTITATPSDGTAAVTIMLNGSTEVANGTPATWIVGENKLEITVTNGEISRTYTVTVTKNE